MMDWREARDRVRENVAPLPPQTVPLHEALHLVLAEDVRSDVDSPPHDKALVDGYAIRAVDAGASPLEVLEEITAGTVPTRSVGPGCASRIMTGAPVPPGADAVVMVERTRLEQSQVWLDSGDIEAGAGILKRAASMERGEVVLPSGRLLRPVEMGLLAEVGCARVPVVPRPRVAVLATGNELVPFHEVPGPGQIRNSNNCLLQALVERAGGTVMDLGIVRDHEADLMAAVEQGLAADLLILSGGVSAGVLDLVPSVLERHGVACIFHKVRLKPGKPIWFGLRNGEPVTPVFGLPGNPVSSLVGFELYVRTAMRLLAGDRREPWASSRAELASPFRHRGERPTFLPVTVQRQDERTAVTPLPWKGSADQATVSRADALAHFPAGDREYLVGDVVDVYPL